MGDSAIPQKASAWQKTPTPNLVRHTASGIYYVRARVRRKEAVRESLRTDNYQIARARLSVRLAELHALAPPRKGWVPLTLWDALGIVVASVSADPSLKARSREAYADVLRSLEPGRPGGVPVTPLVKLTTAEVEAWWSRTARHYAPARANYQLMFVRRALKIARQAGAVGRDPAEKLQPVPIPRTRLKLITREQFALLVKTLREWPYPSAAAVGDWVEFVAYSGMRPEEANAVRWRDVDLVNNVLVVTGGIDGTKNRQDRQVPITEQMAGLLDRIQQRRGGAGDDFILAVRDTARPLRAACAAAGLPRLRRYDLRHLFATRCNESGVDIPTVARWLGHKDGGALAMRTYVHPHAEHEQRAALKVRF